MIILYHQNSKVTQIQKNTGFLIHTSESRSISQILLQLAKKNPNELLIWCHQSLSNHLNIQELDSIFCHKKVLASYNTSEKSYLTNAIGYVNETPFINVNKSVTYPTWLMSSHVGGMHSEVLLTLEKELFFDSDFDYFLNSMAKLAMPIGLFCYSNPTLLKDKVPIENNIVSHTILFRFIKQHYKTLWVFLMFLDFVLYERKFPFLALIVSLFSKRRTMDKAVLNGINEFYVGDKKTVEVDVVIPTNGRKPFLYNVLKDLSKQTLLPKTVIIVEQNPNESAVSELDYLTTETWPFEIKHHFTHQVGACNARNTALDMVESDWVFLADDDIVLETDFLENANKTVDQSNCQAFTFCCYLKNEKPASKSIKQWETFGSGCSLVKTRALIGLYFDLSFEFGFGEDADFGMQLRNKGVDVVYLSQPSILHLKAPVGGFRSKPKLLWQADAILPKPAPTIMLYLIKNYTKEQVLGYKTILFFKFYRQQHIKNPFSYYSLFKKQWSRSQFWAKTLKEQQSL